MASTFIWLSATQVSLGEECERKYGFRYILNIKQPSTPAQELGLAVEQAEITPYLTDGREFSDSPAGRMASAARPFLPPPRSVTPDQLQHEFRIANERFGFLGYKDLRLPSSHVLPNLNVAPGTPAVVDFKTTKWWNYRKTAAVLKTDTQATLYAFDELVSNPELDFVDLYWVSMRSTPESPLADAAHYRAHKDQVAEQFAKIEFTGERLFQIRSAVPAAPNTDEAAKLAYVMSLTPNPNACSEFGGCPHRKTCNIGPKPQRAAQIVQLRRKNQMTNGTVMTALQRLKARKPTETVEAPTVPHVGMSDEELQKRFEAASGAARVVAEEPEPFAGINPPEKDLPPLTPEVTQASVAEEIQRPKRGRPAGSKNKPKDTEPVVEVVPPPEDLTSEESSWAHDVANRQTLTQALRSAAQAFLDATGGR